MTIMIWISTRSKWAQSKSLAGLTTCRNSTSTKYWLSNTGELRVSQSAIWSIELTVKISKVSRVTSLLIVEVGLSVALNLASIKRSLTSMASRRAPEISWPLKLMFLSSGFRRWCWEVNQVKWWTMSFGTVCKVKGLSRCRARESDVWSRLHTFMHTIIENQGRNMFPS